MMGEQHYALGELDRRLGNLLRFGTVSEVDAGRALVRVDLGDLVTDWVPWATRSAGHNREWSALDVGEQVALLSPGDPSLGLVVGSLFQDSHPANGNTGKDWRITFKDGTVLEFDRDASALRVVVAPVGSIVVQVGSTELSMQGGQATLKAADISLQGNVAISGGSLTHNGVNIGSTHAHGGVQTGGGNTSGPH